MKLTDTRVNLASGVLIGFALGMPFGALISAPAAHAAPAAIVQEDDPAWSCVDDGNRICGPGNSNGAPAGCYDEGGVLVAAWPCYVVVDPRTGEGDVYTP